MAVQRTWTDHGIREERGHSFSHCIMALSKQTLRRRRRENCKPVMAHFFEKKDIILPFPGFPPPFFPTAAGAGLLVLAIGLAFFGGGSSSENDSQAASSFVTIDT
jgi:hypothetical protein